MLNLNYLNLDLNKARREHFDFFACYVTKKLFGTTCTKSNTDLTHPDRPVFCNGNVIQLYTFQYNGILFFQEFIRQNNRLVKILRGTPIELFEVHEEFKLLVDGHFGISTYDDYHDLSESNRHQYFHDDVHHFFQDINAIFNYSRLSKDNHYSSYILTENIGVRTCVYCNRTYSITHKKTNGGRLMNPQLDHWFPQYKYPLLQISFHNLIPSCDICNGRVKNGEVFNLTDHHHPYQELEEEVFFNYRYISKNQLKIYFSKSSSPKLKRTSEALFIDEMYDAHRHELKDLIKMRDAYSPEYLKKLQQSFPGAKLSDKEIYRFTFGTEIDKKDFHKRPMSKFKHDILTELGIIKP